MLNCCLIFFMLGKDTCSLMNLVKNLEKSKKRQRCSELNSKVCRKHPRYIEVSNAKEFHKLPILNILVICRLGSIGWYTHVRGPTSGASFSVWAHIRRLFQCMGPPQATLSVRGPTSGDSFSAWVHLRRLFQCIGPPQATLSVRGSTSCNSFSAWAHPRRLFQCVRRQWVRRLFQWVGPPQATLSVTVHSSANYWLKTFAHNDI